MILILCDEKDSSALWAAEAFKLRGLVPMLLSGADLASVKQWQHTVGVADAHFELCLENGVSIQSLEIGAVLNRLSFLPSAWLRSIGGEDREYAIQEMQAFYLSWLHALSCAKFNAPTPQGLCGNWRHPSVWTALAVKAELPVKPFRQTNQDDPQLIWQTWNLPASETIYVVGSKVVGPESLVHLYGNSCLRLAKLAGVLLLSIDFSKGANDRWEMTKASVMPDLIGGGEVLADAIFGAMTA